MTSSAMNGCVNGNGTECSQSGGGGDGSSALSSLPSECSPVKSTVCQQSQSTATAAMELEPSADNRLADNGSEATAAAATTTSATPTTTAITTATAAATAATTADQSDVEPPAADPAQVVNSTVPSQPDATPPPAAAADARPVADQPMAETEPLTPPPPPPCHWPKINVANYTVSECIDQLGSLYKGSGAASSVPLMRFLLGVDVPRLHRDDQDRLNRSKKFAMEQSISMVLMKQTTQQQQQQAHGQQRHQALVLMCRIYVGSISFELREDAVRQAFIPFGPIKLIDMPRDPVAAKHKGFAFVEYETPEAAQLAQDHMSNAILGGRTIKVGRPSNMPQAQIIIQQVREEAKAYSRIYVSSIHPSLTENDIRSVFEAFGTITACKLAMGGVGGSHKGYCYIDYATHAAANEAVIGMNLFDLGGQFLRVGRCCSPPQALEILNGALPPTTGPGVVMPAAASLAAATASAQLHALEEEERRRRILMNGLGSAFPAIKPATPAPVAPPPAPVPVALSSTAPISSASTALLPPPGVANVTQLGAPVVPQPVPLMPSPLLPPPTTGLPMTTAAVAAAVLQMANSAMPLLHHQQQQQQHQLLHQLQQPAPPPLPQQPPPLPPISVAAPPPPIPRPDELTQEELRQRLAASTDSEDAGGDTQTLQQQEEISVRGSAGRQIVMQRLMRPDKPNVVVVLRNAVTPEDVDDNLQDEITEECSKFGETVRVVIYQEAQSELDGAEVIVKIFVEFKRQCEAEAAVSGLNYRYFGGRQVRAELYDMHLYEANDLSA